MPPKGYKLSEEQKKRMSESAKKRKPLSKEVIDKRNESIRKRYQEDPSVSKKISEKLKGENNPMYGKTHTEDARKKISEAQINRVFTEEERKTRSKMCLGENNPNYGNNVSEESKQAISRANTGRKFSKETLKLISENSTGKNNGMYGKHHTEESKKKMSEIKIGLKLSEETKKKLSIKLSGDKNPAWIDGRSFEPYCPKWTNELKERIRSFFEYECTLCGKKQEDNNGKLSCHHVEYNKDACCDGKPVHFAALCRSCHAKTNYDRERWENIIHMIIYEIYDGKSYYIKNEWKQIKQY